MPKWLRTVDPRQAAGHSSSRPRTAHKPALCHALLARASRRGPPTATPGTPSNFAISAASSSTSISQLPSSHWRSARTALRRYRSGAHRGGRQLEMQRAAQLVRAAPARAIASRRCVESGAARPPRPRPAPACRRRRPARAARSSTRSILLNTSSSRISPAPMPLQHLAHLFDALIAQRIAGIDDVQQQVRVARLLQRRAECRDQFVRQLAHEADRVGEHHLADAARASIRRTVGSRWRTAGRPRRCPRRSAR